MADHFTTTHDSSTHRVSNIRCKSQLILPNLSVINFMLVQLKDTAPSLRATEPTRRM